MSFHKIDQPSSSSSSTSTTMTRKLTYPCTECNFEAQSARQLSRHKAVTHTQNALKCVLCPFVTAYQTNLLRHRKDVHGICGSKGNKSCKFCGFVSEDNDTLIQHQIEFHQDILKTAQAKFAKELVSAGGEETNLDFTVNFEAMNEDNFNFNINTNAIKTTSKKRSSKSSKQRKQQQQQLHQQNNYDEYDNNHNPMFIDDDLFIDNDNNNNNNNEDIDDDVDDDDDERAEFEEFWKAGFIDDNVLHSQQQQQYFNNDNQMMNNFNIASIPLITLNTDADSLQHQQNNDNSMVASSSSRSSTPKSQQSSSTNKLNVSTNNNNNLADLPATRIRRQYNCNDCGFRTVNPREFLYHRRDGHGYKVKIVECPYCVYACQYVQKLQRHLLLVHKLNSINMNSPDQTASAQVAAASSSSTSLNGGEIEQLLIKPKINRPNNNNMNDSTIDGNLFEMNLSIINDDNDESIPDDNTTSSINNINNGNYDNINNFELSLNEQEDIEIESSNTSNNDSDDKKFMFNLECYICKVKFGDAISAQRHFLKHHKQSTNQYVNNSNDMIISSSSASASLMKQNQKKLYTNEMMTKNPNICNFCGYRTRWVSELERHIRVHSKEKPFKCSKCNFRSKWKGDLNRHMQRYHLLPNQNPTILQNEIESNGNSPTNNNENVNLLLNYNQQLDEDLNTNGDVSEMIDYDNNIGNNNNGLDQNGFNSNNNNDSYDNDDELINNLFLKMYKCTYCNFTCNTASRFHVHYVQHLNTKPFQCSICGHRSNWEWDVTKHIKMKAQRDPIHENAHPVLIHDSGKRDYAKYDKFLVYIGREDGLDYTDEINERIEYRNKKFKNDEFDDGLLIDNNNNNNNENNDNDNDENNANLDNVGNLLIPEVNFEIDDINNGAIADDKITNNNNGNNNNNNRSNIRSRFVTKSSIISRHPNSSSKIISCSNCNFRHHFARVMVAHMSNHHESKPYGCNECSFETKWREMMYDHYSKIHSDLDPNDFEIRFRCVIDENAVCRILTAEEMDNISSNISLIKDLSILPTLDDYINDHNSKFQNQFNSSLIEPNLYEEKTVIRCEYCPFITTNMKKMSIHCRFHNPSKGRLKCKHCPYYINDPDKLIRHEKLHQKTDITIDSNHSNETLSLTTAMNNNFDYKPIKTKQQTYRTANLQSLNEHINNAHSENIENSIPDHVEDIDNDNINDDGINENDCNNENNDNFNDDNDNDNYQSNHDILEQTVVENTNDINDDDNRNIGNSNNNDNGMTLSNSKSDNQTNNDDKSNDNEVKTFSYICPDCPAAFKSSSDYNVHAHFHSSNYQHGCPYCTYKARNKPQLCKHLYVHTSEYLSKRTNSTTNDQMRTENSMKNSNTNNEVDNILHSRNQSSSSLSMNDNNNNNNDQNCNQSMTNALNNNNDDDSSFGNVKINKKIRKRSRIQFPMKPVRARFGNEENGKQKIIFKSAHLMASQEFLETKEYLQKINSGIKNRCMYRCTICPAVFIKVNTLIYHIQQHENNDSKYKCDTCNYSTDEENNLNIHLLLHNLNESQSAIGYNFNFNCHKCPAGFAKRTRLDKHLSLHGAEYQWKCDLCDYSVNYAATLVKHRALHLINPNFQAIEFESSNDNNNIEHSRNDVDQNVNQNSYENGDKSDLKLKLNLAEIRNEFSNQNYQINNDTIEEEGEGEEEEGDDDDDVEDEDIDNEDGYDFTIEQETNEEEENDDDDDGEEEKEDMDYVAPVSLLEEDNVEDGDDNRIEIVMEE